MLGWGVGALVCACVCVGGNGSGSDVLQASLIQRLSILLLSTLLVGIGHAKLYGIA